MLEVKSLTITLKNGPKIAMSPDAAFNLLMMPSMAGLVLSMVPEYGLPSLPVSESKE